MASTPGMHDWPRSPPLAPDTTSPVYPDRPIRPLPKRRLRDRLSAESAAEYALPAQQTSSPLFSFPIVNSDRESEIRYAKQHGGEHDHGHHNCSQCAEHDDSDLDSEDEHSHLGYGGYHHQGYDGTVGSRGVPPPPDSATSSADGYESFENTNNKKKRKIPQSNGLSGHGHHSTLSSDMGSLGLSGRDGEALLPGDGSPAVGSYYGTGSAVLPSASGNGLSGPGRGRYGRPSRGSLDRRPLGVSSNGMNATASGRIRAGAYGNSKAPPQGQSPGIISAAIANAAQQGPLTPEDGNENVSLLRQQANRTPPHKTEFTFQSTASKQFSWPGPQQADLPPPPNHQPYGHHPGIHGAHNTQATQTSPHMSNQRMTPGQHQQQATAGAQQHPAPPAPAIKKKPRKPGKIYEVAARQRKIQQEYQNYHHPPRREDIWICEFCEYEDIFGVPPVALIREYERKDRAEQKRLEEKRRLLEKAKMKGRKGKKGAGNGNKNNAKNPPAQNATAGAQNPNAPPQQHHQQPGGPIPPPAGPHPHQRYETPADLDYGDEEYYEDDYDDDEGLTPLVPTSTPQPQTPINYPAQVPAKGQPHAGLGGGGGRMQAAG